MRSLVILASICMLLYKADAKLRCYECLTTKCGTNITTCERHHDRCLTASVTVHVLGTIPYEKDILKGCASEHMCDDPQSLQVFDSVKCCQGDLCNGAESFTLSFLLMFIPLLSSILFY